MAALFRIVIAAGLLWLAGGLAEAKTKRALIVGVGDYSELTDLQKTTGDANGYAEVFRDKLGYETVQLIDADRAAFSEAFGKFLEQIEPGDEVVFIFSGHGWSDGAENYLVMSDAPREASEYRLKQETFALSGSILAGLRDRNPDLVLAIIDACRDNPFDGGTRSGFSRGLTRITSQRGSMVMFAADSGERALDRLGTEDTSPYSVFTRTLLPKLEDPFMSLQEIAISVKSEVSGLARSVHHEQLPTYYDGLSDRQCLQGECLGRSRGGLGEDGEAWLAISQVAIGAPSSAEDCDSFREFAERYPDSPFGNQARKVSARCGSEGEGPVLPPAEETAPGGVMSLEPGFYRTTLISYPSGNEPVESALAGEPGICLGRDGALSTRAFLETMLGRNGWTDCQISDWETGQGELRSTWFRLACTVSGRRVTGPGSMVDGDDLFDFGVADGDWIMIDPQTSRGTFRITGYRDGPC